MDSKENIRKAFKNMTGKNPVQIFWAKITEINETNETCSAKALVSNLEYSDILLSINKSGIVEIPEVNSKILCGIIENNKASVFVIKTEKTDKIIIRNSGDYILSFDGKIEIKNNTGDLKTIISDLINAIKIITVPTGVGPSGVPINVVQFDAVLQKLNLLMK